VDVGAGAAVLAGRHLAVVDVLDRLVAVDAGVSGMTLAGVPGVKF